MIRRVVALVAVLVVLAGALSLVRDSSSTTITAYFSSATGLYRGDDVRVLGVRVGKVTSIEPRGDRVRVRLRVDSGTPIPTTVKAAIVAPSLVSGRFVQLAPAWVSGPRLHDGAVIEQDRTAVPVSFDQVKRELTDLATALGPQGSDGTGALGQAITTIDANLARGNDAQLRSAISALRESADALGDRRSDLFQTVANLSSFTRNLATSDAAVRGFSTRLAAVTGYLDANRSDLRATLAELARLTRTLDSFLRHHSGRIQRGVSRAGVLAGTLADQADELATILHIAPHAIINLYNTVEDGAITGRLALANLDSTATLVCGALLSVGAGADTCHSALQPLLKTLGLSAVPGSAADHQLGNRGGGR